MARNRKESVGVRERRQGQLPRTQAALLRGALEWFSKDCSLIDLPLHGNVGWKAIQLVVLGVLWSWSDQARLTGAFEHARQLATETFGLVAVTTYQGMMGALRSYTEHLLPRLWLRLHGLMEKVGGAHWRIGRWVALAVDGS